MFLDRHRKVGAAFDGGIVRDDQHVASGHAADPGHQAGARRVAVVHVVRREWRQFEERRLGIEQQREPLAHRKLALLTMALEILRAAAFARARSVGTQLDDELPQAIAVGEEGRVGWVDVRVEDDHHQPQQSVLNPHDAQRQTACMRYMSAPHRSHSVLSSPPATVVSADAIRVIGRLDEGCASAGVEDVGGVDPEGESEASDSDMRLNYGTVGAEQLEASAAA